MLDGEDITGYCVTGSTKLDSKTGTRGTASTTLKLDPGVTYRPVKGKEVYMTDPETGEHFGGVLYGRSRRTSNLGYRYFDLSFVDFTFFADRVLLYGELDNTTSGAVVQWIISNFLAQFGVTSGVIEGTAVIDKVTYNGQTATAALNELADNEGATWTIDAAKKLGYRGRESYAAPFSISDAYRPISGFSADDSLDGYANRRRFKGADKGISDLRTEQLTGDGVKREFALRYPCHSSVSVALNGVAATLGIKGVDSGKQWYWKEDDDLIAQDDAGTVLTSSDTLSVTYRGTYPLNLMVEDVAEIEAHGLYESLDEDSNVPYLDLALEKVETAMRQNPWDKATVGYRTRAPGLKAGMLQHIQLSDEEFDDDILIISVTAQETRSAGWPLEYTVKGVNGERLQDYLDFYRSLASRSKYKIRQNETVTQVGKVEATCELGSSVSYITKPSGKWDGSSKWNGGAAWW